MERFWNWLLRPLRLRGFWEQVAMDRVRDCDTLRTQLAAAEEVIDLGEQFELAIGIDGCLEGGPCSLKERCKKTAPWSVSHIQKCCVELDKKRRAYRNTYGEVE